MKIVVRERSPFGFTLRFGGERVVEIDQHHHARFCCYACKGYGNPIATATDEIEAKPP